MTDTSPTLGVTTVVVPSETSTTTLYFDVVVTDSVHKHTCVDAVGTISVVPPGTSAHSSLTTGVSRGRAIAGIEMMCHV